MNLSNFKEKLVFLIELIFAALLYLYQFVILNKMYEQCNKIVHNNIRLKSAIMR